MGEALADWSGNLPKADEQSTMQAMKNLGASVASLPAGSKLRRAMLASTVSRAYCMILLCVAVARSGRAGVFAGVFATSFIARAATTLPPSVEMTRGLMTTLSLSSQFNGIAALAPEVGLVIAASSGTQTSSLQTSAMTNTHRQDLASELESTIGAGGSRNRAIIQDQAKAGTNMLAFGFRAIANELFPGVDRYNNNKWGFMLALLITIALAVVETSQPAVNSLVLRSVDGPSLLNANSVFTNERLASRVLKFIHKSSRIVGKHFKLTVVQAPFDLFDWLCQAFGHESIAAGSPPADEEGEEEEGHGDGDSKARRTSLRESPFYRKILDMIEEEEARRSEEKAQGGQPTDEEAGATSSLGFGPTGTNPDDSEKGKGKSGAAPKRPAAPPTGDDDESADGSDDESEEDDEDTSGNVGQADPKAQKPINAIDGKDKETLVLCQSWQIQIRCAEVSVWLLG